MVKSTGVVLVLGGVTTLSHTLFLDFNFHVLARQTEGEMGMATGKDSEKEMVTPNTLFLHELAFIKQQNHDNRNR
jgi:hypothetical protein